MDRNTKYFHALASHQRRKNNIQGIKNSNGDWILENEGICNEFKSFFQNQSASTNPPINGFLDVITQNLSDEDNRVLTKEITDREIKVALDSTNADKAPVPD